VREALAVFLGAAIAFALTLLFAITARIDAGVHEGYMGALFELRSLNARVNETVLKGRLGLTRSADPLAEMMRATTAVHLELGRVPAFLSTADRDRVLAAIGESARFQRDRQRNVERFVAEDAALAASLRILAPETRKLAADVEAVGGRVLADHAYTLRLEVLELAASREQGHVAAINDAIAALRRDTWPGQAEKLAAERLVAHVNNVALRRQRVDALTNVIVTEDAMDRAIAIEAVYGAGVEGARSAWLRSVVLLFALALVMLAAAAAYVIARLRTAARHLGVASAQLKSAMSALQEERAKERELAELKTRFVAMTSHEFRTPLSVISTSAELLQGYGEKWASDKRGEHLARIRRSVSGMTTMLDRILLIGKTEAGMLAYSGGRVALGRLCMEIAQSIELADKGKRRISAEVSGAVGMACADEKLVRHILENLLSNAVKFSPEGAVVRFTAERDGDDVILVVADDGIGIPEEDRARLFDGFHRARNATHISGTGLGLSVVKRAVELHRGTIDIDSAEGEGTTFTVRIRAEEEGQ
jgi:signal transduction histidine kinase